PTFSSLYRYRLPLDLHSFPTDALPISVPSEAQQGPVQVHRFLLGLLGLELGDACRFLRSRASCKRWGRSGRWGRGSRCGSRLRLDRKSTRLNSSHVKISYAVFCLKKKI